MNWRRSTHWNGTAPVAGFAAPVRKASGMASESEATAPLTLALVIFVSATTRPFSSYFCVVAMRTPSIVCQSDSTRS